MFACEALIVSTGEGFLVFARVVRAVFTSNTLVVWTGDGFLVFARVVRTVFAREVLAVPTGDVLLVFARVVRAVVIRDVQLLFVFGGFDPAAAFFLARSCSSVLITDGMPRVRGQARRSFVTSFSRSGSGIGFSVGGAAAGWEEGVCQT